MCLPPARLVAVLVRRVPGEDATRRRRGRVQALQRQRRLQARRSRRLLPAEHPRLGSAAMGRVSVLGDPVIQHCQVQDMEEPVLLVPGHDRACYAGRLQPGEGLGGVGFCVTDHGLRPLLNIAETLGDFRQWFEGRGFWACDIVLAFVFYPIPGLEYSVVAVARFCKGWCG